MSFDRVLPRPPALYNESANRLHRNPSSLLEHKIMHDSSRPMSIVDNIPRSPATMPRSNDSDGCSTALSQMKLSSINREKIAENSQIQPGMLSPSRQRDSSGGSTVEMPLRERSASGSPIKLESAKEAASQFCLCQPDPKIPRPRNAFILYRQHYQAAVVAQNPGLANPEISKIIGEQWRALPTDTKDEWKALAEAEKARHQQQYPDYRYQPRRFGRDGFGRNGSVSAGGQLGPITCNRCGGRLMNPPSTPHTPLTATISPMTSRSSQGESTSSHNSSSRESSKSERRANSMQMFSESDRRMSQWKEADPAPGEAKRRRLNSTAFQRTDSPDSEPYSLSSQKTYISRPGVGFFRSHVDTSPNGRAPRRGDGEGHSDPSLILPPLKSTGLSAPHSQSDTVMNIPVLNKIKVLANISPPLSDRSESPPKGIVVAIDGQDPTQVRVMMEHLGRTMSQDSKYVVRIFEGPDLLGRQGSTTGQMGDGTVDYLNVISAWHRISDEIIQFVSSGLPVSESKDSSRTGTPQSDTARSTERSPSPSIISDNAIPVALVPRYQLTTADAFACTIPIKDRYALLDHWQWMASLWRACVGPDVTIHIRECDRDEMERHGSGNPVEVRLTEARTLIVRRLSDSTKDLEEKALRRVGFELEDFLTR